MFFLRDTIHLSDMGDIFLQIAKGIVSILKNNSVQVSPRLGENVPWLRYDWLLIGHSFILLVYFLHLYWLYIDYWKSMIFIDNLTLT